MRFDLKHASKWVATKGEKVVDSGRSLKALMRRSNKRPDSAKVRYSLVPKGGIAGVLYGV